MACQNCTDLGIEKCYIYYINKRGIRHITCCTGFFFAKFGPKLSGKFSQNWAKNQKTRKYEIFNTGEFRFWLKIEQKSHFFDKNWQYLLLFCEKLPKDSVFRALFCKNSAILSKTETKFLQNWEIFPKLRSENAKTRKYEIFPSGMGLKKCQKKAW